MCDFFVYVHFLLYLCGVIIKTTIHEEIFTLFICRTVVLRKLSNGGCYFSCECA